jgi:uncharacterized peroxidase-related enzyme
MAFIETTPEREASGEVAELYAADRDRLGYVANHTRVFAHRPAVHRAWQQLSGALRESMGLRRYELVTVAAARRLRSSYCVLAHGMVLADELLGPERVRDVVLDHRSAGLDEADVAVMDFAERIVDDATAVSEADVERLRDLGLSDDEIFDVAAAAGARCFFSKTLDALGVQPDVAFAELDLQLREALTVGRPIAGS